MSKGQHEIQSLVKRGVVVTIGSILLFSLFMNSWSWSRIPVMSPRFADLRLVTHTVDCMQNGTWSFENLTCDPFGRPFNYPPLFAHIFSALSLGSSTTEAVGFTLGILVIFIFGLALWFSAVLSSDFWRFVICGLCVVSPPVALQLERGNTDGFILALIALAVVVHYRAPSLSAIGAATTVGLKLFSGPIVLAYLTKRGQGKQLLIFIGSAIAISSFSVVNFVQLVNVQWIDDEQAFGFLSLLKQHVPIALQFDRVVLLAANAAIIIIPAFVISTLWKSQVAEFVQKLNVEVVGSALVMLAGLTFVGATMSGSRYDYSLIFLVLAVSGVAQLPRTFLSDLLLALSLVATWGASWFDPKSTFGDLAAIFCAWILLAISIRRCSDTLREFIVIRTS